MLKFFRRSDPKSSFDKNTLRKNNISLLTLDERWNNLFANTQKNDDIRRSEEKIKDLLKEHARLITESKEILQHKKIYMEKIMKLTVEAFENNNDEAHSEMQACEKEIKKINERLPKIEQALENVPEHMKDANIELLEQTVNCVYFKIRESQRRVKELEGLIEETREKLKLYIDEKEALSQDYTDIYTYFHDLLGAEELERLDKEHFK
jgi:seryl-tRNA synthetase